MKSHGRVIQASGRTVFPLLIAGHYDASARYFVEREEGRNDWLLLISLDGLGRVASGKIVASLPPGALALIPPQAPQDYRTAPEGPGFWDFVWIHFFPPLHWHTLLNWGHGKKGSSSPRMHLLDLRATLPSAERRVRAQTLTAVRHAAEDTPNGDALAMNALEAILLWCQRALGTHPHSAERDTFAQTVRAHILWDLAHPPSAEALAAHTHLSLSRFRHRFKATFGLTLTEYIDQMRMARAKQLLLSEVCDTVKAAARTLGFNDPAYFTRRFTALYGFPPSDLLKHTSVSTKSARDDTRAET